MNNTDSSSEQDSVDLMLESFLKRCRDGECPTIDEYIARCPERSKEIREAFSIAIELEGLKSNQHREPRIPPVMNEPSIERIGEFQIVREIGRGGMGVVYEAYQTMLARRVAIKVLPRALTDLKSVERFRREAQAAASLQHSHIVPVFDFGEEGDFRFFTMQLIDGCSLDKLVLGWRSTLPQLEWRFREAARMIQQAAAAIDYAHSRAVLHRDVKPSNILVDSKGHVWVADFGLAKLMESPDGVPSRDFVGTLRYMSPERFNGSSEVRSDVYGLGATLYELITLQPLFTATTQAELIRQVLRENPIAPRRLEPRIPRDLETIVQKSLAREPEERYRTAADLADDLDRFLTARPIRARRSGVSEQFRLWCRRSPVIAALSASVATLTLMSALISIVAAVYLRLALLESESQRSQAERASAVANARLWDSLVAQGRARRNERRPGQRFESLTPLSEAVQLVLPDGRSIDLLRDEASAALCLPDFRVCTSWNGSPPGVRCLTLTPEFNRYARGYEDGTVEVRTTPENSEVCRFQVPGAISGYFGLGFSPEGSRLHVAFETNGNRSRKGQVWDLTTERPRLVCEDDGQAFSFEPGGTRFAAVFDDGTVRIADGAIFDGWHSITGIRVISPHLTFIAWNPCHPTVALHDGGNIQIFDLIEQRVVAVIPCEQPWAIDWHPDGRLLAVVITASRTIELWDTVRNVRVRSLVGHRSDGIILRFSRTGDLLASNDWTGLLRLWDVATGDLVLTHPAIGTCLEFSQDGMHMAAAIRAPAVDVFEFQVGREFRTLRTVKDTLQGAGTILVAPSGRLAAASETNGVLLFDLEQGIELARLPNATTPLRFNSDGDFLWCYGPHLVSWPVTTTPAGVTIGAPQRMLEDIGLGLWGVDGAGTQVAIPRNNAGVDLCRLPGGPFRRIGSPQPDVRMAALSPDGRWLATGSHFAERSSGVIVWETERGTIAANLPVAGLHC
jgi:serine/threonine protein kinase/WD40 repeat protein